YTGKNWVNTGTFTELDSFPPPPESLLDSLAKTNLTIKHNRIRTRSLFIMLYPQKITSLPGTLLIDQNSGMILSRSIPLNNEYYLEGYYLAYRLDIARLEQDEDLSKMEPFLRLPADLPSRVKQLALKITGDQEGYYNKLKALETYLRLNYSYNTEIPFLPNDRDFVDFFLFDLREGYCTSFASALAVMGRAAGIPTRYVVGFAVPNIPSENGIYQVAGSNAHAWVEGYIPGIGWLTFEATSTFRTADALPIRQEAVDHYIASAGNTDRRTGSINNREISGIDSDYLAYNNEISTAAFFAGLRKIFTAALLVTLFSVTFSILYRFRQVKAIFKDLDNQNNKLRAVGYYNLALSLLERVALAKYPGETPREYSRRIIRDVHNWTLNFREISEGINLALYSKHKISSDLAEQTALFFHYIFECYLAKVGNLTALIEILFRGKYFINRAPIKYFS
ncbi:MAG: transglutaminase domain-containing protein, partial [Clostridia bacterium]|nr:transglutaminase domain-containing protein [Clostridia bacterium]